MNSSGGRRRLVFVDHSFHEKSRATTFLIELLEERFDVQVLWDDSWAGGAGISDEQLNALAPEVVVLFQLLRTPESLRRLRCRNVVLVPMFDASEGIAEWKWLAYRRWKFLNFSSTLAARHERIGIESLGVRFVRPPEALSVRFDGLRGFFWQRRSEVTWEHVRRLVGGTRFESFHLHLAVDPPGFQLVQPSDEEMRRFNITISHWFESATEYRRHLARANVFFAPRVTEGIGQSFLEAMSAGMLVVAPNRPTMNEYITHGVNGLLFDPSRPGALDFSKAAEIGERAWRDVRVGHDRWIADRHEILKFVAGETPRTRKGVRQKLQIVLRRTTCTAPRRIKEWVRLVRTGFRRPYAEIPSRIPGALEREFSRLFRREQ